MFATIPGAPVHWRDKRLNGAWWVLCLAALVAVVFLPSTMTNGDEYLYAGQARMLLRGHLLPVDGDPIPAIVSEPDAVIRYPLGWPLLLALPALVGFRAMFLAPLVMHLLGAAAVARMLVRRGVPSWLTALYVFHPVLWSYSRTLISDAPTVAVVLLAMDAWENRQTITAAGALGYSVLMRVASIGVAAGWLLALLPEVRLRWRSVVGLAVAVGLAAAGVLAVSAIVHGRAMHSNYSAIGSSMISPSMFGENAALYMLGLTLIPPCPLLCMILDRKACDRWALAAVPTLVFFVFYAYHETSHRWIETFLAGQRLILPAHAMLLVATSAVWARTPGLNRRWLVTSFGLIAGVAGCVAVRHLEGRYAPAARLVHACSATTIAFNTNAARIVLSSDAREYRTVEGREPTSLANLIVVAPKAPTNRAAPSYDDYELPPSLAARLTTSCQQVGEFYFFDLDRSCPRVGAPCVKPSP
jgi:hypothetical protein